MSKILRVYCYTLQIFINNTSCVFELLVLCLVNICSLYTYRILDVRSYENDIDFSIFLFAITYTYSIQQGYFNKLCKKKHL